MPDDRAQKDEESYRIAREKRRAAELSKDTFQLFLYLAGFGIVSTFVISFVGALFISEPSTRQDYRSPSGRMDLATRIEILTSELNAAAKTIGAIEAEIAQRRELVKKMEGDAEVVGRLRAVNLEHAEAIAQTLRGELKRQADHHWWTENWLHAAYTVLGVFLAELYHFMSPRIRRWWSRGAQTASDS